MGTSVLKLIADSILYRPVGEGEAKEAAVPPPRSPSVQVRCLTAGVLENQTSTVPTWASAASMAVPMSVRVKVRVGRYQVVIFSIIQFITHARKKRSIQW